jgi:hypothetical protein
MDMQKNVIILTSGLSGSSVLTGLIARGGYWTGDETFRKKGAEVYETFENQKLIDLNRKLFAEAAYVGNYLVECSTTAIQDISLLYPKLDCSEYRDFVAHCDSHRPWIWKDPRLWLTIRFWKNLLDLDQCRFILLTRGSVQSWVSTTLRRQIMTYRYSKTYEETIKASILEFFEETHLPYLHLGYEELISRPKETVQRLNAFLDAELSVDDLKKVYHKPLYKNPRNSWAKHVKALLIYLKNYSERRDITVNS